MMSKEITIGADKKNRTELERHEFYARFGGANPLTYSERFALGAYFKELLFIDR